VVTQRMTDVASSGKHLLMLHCTGHFL